MRPLLALHIEPDRGIDPAYVADVLNVALDREFGRGGEELVSVRAITSPEELSAYEAGQMVMYRKPARRQGDIITYQANGEVRRLQQTSLFGNGEDAKPPTA